MVGSVDGMQQNNEDGARSMYAEKEGQDRKKKDTSILYAEDAETWK